MAIIPLSMYMFGYITMSSDVKTFVRGGMIFFLVVGVVFFNCL